MDEQKAKDRARLEASYLVLSYLLMHPNQTLGSQTDEIWCPSKASSQHGGAVEHVSSKHVLSKALKPQSL